MAEAALRGRGRPIATASARGRWARARLLRNRNVCSAPAIFAAARARRRVLAGVSPPTTRRALDPVNRLKPPSAANFLGTDEFGRDVWSLVVHGSRVSLLVGSVTMLLTSLGGVVIGLVAGYYRRLDTLVMRVTDGLMAFPGHPPRHRLHGRARARRLERDPRAVASSTRRAPRSWSGARC